MERQRIHSDNAPAAVGPYSQANVVGDFVFCSGQVGLNPETGKFTSDTVEGQAQQALANMKAVLEAAGSGMDKVVKTTVFLTDIGDYKAVNEVYASFFAEPYPARSAVAVKELPLGALVEVEVIAVK